MPRAPASRYQCQRCKKMQRVLTGGHICYNCRKQEYSYDAEVNRPPAHEREARVQYYGKRADLKLGLFDSPALLAAFLRA